MFVRQMPPGIAFVPAMLASPPCVPYHLPCAAASVLCLSQGSVHLLRSLGRCWMCLCLTAHLLFSAGFVLFLCLGILTMLRPNMYFMAPLQEKVVFGMFFLGAVLCLSFSWLFHTVYCHSEKVSRTFSK